jgi:hypothetical protein
MFIVKLRDLVSFHLVRFHPVDFRRQDTFCQGDDPESSQCVGAQETSKVLRDRIRPTQLDDFLGSALDVDVELLVAQSSRDDGHSEEVTNIV